MKGRSSTSPHALAGVGLPDTGAPKLRLHNRSRVVSEKLSRLLAVDVNAVLARVNKRRVAHEVTGYDGSAADELLEFATIRCCVTGKRLGRHPRSYLQELAEIHGTDRARTALQLVALRHREAFTQYRIVGETLNRLLTIDPVTFYMFALSRYLRWEVDSSHSTPANAEMAWLTISQKGRCHDAISYGLRDGSLAITTLLEGCELLRRYLAIAGKHAQETHLMRILSHLDTGTAVADDTRLDMANDIIRDELSRMVDSVTQQRRDITRKTNIVAAVRERFGGLSEWQASIASERFRNADEANVAVLDALSIVLRPLSHLTPDQKSDMLKRSQQLARQERMANQYTGKVRELAKDAAVPTLKIPGA